MQALKYEAEVGAGGEIILPRLSLNQGTPVEITVVVRDADADDQEGLRQLASKTMDFWDNPIDDEVWNNA